MNKKSVPLILILIIFLAPHAWSSHSLDFTSAEKIWIKQHPVITYTSNDNWPLEYHKGDKSYGLSRAFLDKVEKQTGLKFLYVPEVKARLTETMMLSAVYEKFLTEEEKKGWLYTAPWMNSIPMVVTRNETTGFRNLNGLEGKKVAISNGSGYTNWLKRRYPEINLIIKDNVLEAFKSVDDHESDAVIGTGLVILPILQRNFSERMAITSQPPELAVGINMAVREGYPELRSILDKSLVNMAAGDVEQSYDEWIGISQLGAPTLGVIWEHYRVQVATFSILVIILFYLLRRTIVAKRQAQKSELRKSNFLAMMSHEIRTPMNAVIASIELLRQTEVPVKRQEYIDLAYSSSQNLLELLNNVLDHSKLTQHRFKLEKNVFEISEMLRVFYESQKPAATKKGIELHLRIPEALHGQWLIADAHRLRQIISNVCSNAIKFTYKGSVTIDVSEVFLEGDQHRLTFTITDSGIGIPEASIARLFEAWEQGGNHVAQAHAGSGLGLFICHELVELMDGKIDIKSDIGIGTVVQFTISVEMSEGKESADGLHKATLPDFNHQVSVLIVEDHPVNQKLLEDQLDVMFCCYEVAKNGEEALALLKDENYYDIILLDCNLPGKDGYEVARLIRDYEQVHNHTRTPVIAISALNTATHFESCVNSGMDDVLTKPIRLEDLAGMLSKWCKLSVNTRTVSFARPALNQGVLESLNMDLIGFTRASEGADLRHAIHFIHRIGGIAQIYNLSQLAVFALECERELRNEEIPVNWPLQEWVSELKRLIVRYDKKQI